MRMPGLIAELGGYALRRLAEYRRILRIRDRIHTKVADLTAEIATSPEPTPFAELDRSAFRPLTPGTAWGDTFDCAWLRITGSVPPGSRDAMVMLGIRGRRVLVEPDGDGRVEFYADVAYNGWLLYDVGKPVFHGAHLAHRDEAAFAFYYDYLTLAVLADATDDAALAGEVNHGLREAYRRFRKGDIAGARGNLAPLLAAPSDSGFVYSAIGHGHLDMAWLWPLRETRRKAARTYTRALNNIDRTEGYLYGTSQPQQMQWMKHEHPALFQRMKDAVATGRMELQGAFWVEPDTNLPSGE